MPVPSSNRMILFLNLEIAMAMVVIAASVEVGAVDAPTYIYAYE